MSNAQESNKSGGYKIIIVFFAFIISAMVWISVSLSEQYFTTLEVPVKILNLPDGYSFDSDLPEKLTVKLKIIGWKLLVLQNSVQDFFVLSAPRDFHDRKIDLKNALSNNSWLTREGEIISVSPEQAEIRIARAFSKKVRIVPNARFDFKDGFGLAKPIELSPDSVILTGTKSALERIDSITTDDYKGVDLEKRAILQLALKKQLGIRASDDFVFLTLEVQKILDKDFFDISLEAVNLPADRQIRFFPDKITVNVQGWLDVLSRLTNKDFRAIVDYKEIISDSLGVIAPNVILPLFVEKKYIDPPKVRVVIRKI